MFSSQLFQYTVTVRIVPHFSAFPVQLRLDSVLPYTFCDSTTVLLQIAQ